MEELEISGDILNEIAYHKGSPYTGKRYGLHLNGQKSMEGNYKDGKMDGLWTQWHENGQKQREVNFKDGKEDGLAVMWNQNGTKVAEVNFKDGKKVIGSEKFWNNKGEPVKSLKEALKE